MRPRGHIQMKGGIGHASGQGAVNRGVIHHPKSVGAVGNPPIADLETETARHRGGNPDRTAAIAGRGQGHHAPGDARRGAAARAPRRSVEVPWIARFTEEQVLGNRGVAELRGIGLAHHDGSGPTQPFGLQRIARCKIVLEGNRAITRHHPLGIFEILHAKGDALQGAPASIGDASIGASRLGEKNFFVTKAREAVQAGLGFPDPPQGLAHQLLGGKFSCHQIGAQIGD